MTLPDTWTTSTGSRAAVVAATDADQPVEVVAHGAHWSVLLLYASGCDSWFSLSLLRFELVVQVLMSNAMAVVVLCLVGLGDGKWENGNGRREEGVGRGGIGPGRTEQ